MQGKVMVPVGWLDYVLVGTLAFVLGIMDASFGMGYGTFLTPALLLLGFDVHWVVPAVIVSQLAGNFLAVFVHHRFKNVNISLCSRDLGIGAALALFSIVGSTVAALLALRLPEFWLDLYIGVLVAGVGAVLLFTHRKKRDFSWKRLLFLGSIASFNKGLSGGGYGPIVTSGQILTGVDARAAVGITALAEGVASLSAGLTYILVGSYVDWRFTAALAVGISLSTPIAGFVVSRLHVVHLKVIVGSCTLLLGTLTILEAFAVL